MHNVPAYSQYQDITEQSVQQKSCGIVSLYMVLLFWSQRGVLSRTLPSVNDFVKEGFAFENAYTAGVGWRHKELAMIAQEYGLEGYNVDDAQRDIEEAWGKIEEAVIAGPVIVSVYKNLDPSQGGGHLVVVTGIRDGMVQYNDPGAKTKEEVSRTAQTEIFLRGWKKRSVVVYSK